MRVRGYRSAYATDFIKNFEMEVGELTEVQKKNIQTYWSHFTRGMPILIIENIPKGTFLGRLTIPLFFLLIIVLMLVVSPIKWILTGKYYLNNNGKIAEMLDKWCKKMGLNYYK